jgi:hypothetical protein
MMDHDAKAILFCSESLVHSVSETGGRCCRQCRPIADALRDAERAGFDKAKAWAANLVRESVGRRAWMTGRHGEADLLREIAGLIESLADETAVDATPAKS